MVAKDVEVKLVGDRRPRNPSRRECRPSARESESSGVSESELPPAGSAAVKPSRCSTSVTTCLASLKGRPCRASRRPVARITVLVAPSHRYWHLSLTTRSGLPDPAESVGLRSVAACERERGGGKFRGRRAAELP